MNRWKKQVIRTYFDVFLLILLPLQSLCNEATTKMNDFFQFKHFTIWHDRCALKVGTDGVLTGAWACSLIKSNFSKSAPATPSNPPHPNTISTKSAPYSSTSFSCLDIGTGSGVIAMMIAQEFPYCSITAIDIDQPSVEQAIININRAQMSERISVCNTDFSQTFIVGQQWHHHFNLIVTNPPFYEEGNRAQNERVNYAKHTSTLSFEQLIDGGRQCLSPGGHFIVILPSDSSLRFIALCAERQIYLTHRCDVFTSDTNAANCNPRRTLLAFTDSIHPTLRTSLITHHNDGSMTEQFRRLTSEFYL